MSNRRAAVIAAAAIGVAAAGTTAVLLLGSGSEPGPTASPGPAAVDAREAGSAADALRVLATDPASLVAADVRPEVGGRLAEAVPPGTAVAPDVASWAPDGVGGGTMSVTLTPPGRPPVAYAAVMVREGGAWKVLATIPFDES